MVVPEEDEEEVLPLVEVLRQQGVAMAEEVAMAMVEEEATAVLAEAEVEEEEAIVILEPCFMSRKRRNKSHCDRVDKF